ncbi:hypothetical protein Dimus_011579 [Dionaea muscipula]
MAWKAKLIKSIVLLPVVLKPFQNCPQSLGRPCSSTHTSQSNTTFADDKSDHLILPQPGSYEFFEAISPKCLLAADQPRNIMRRVQTTRRKPLRHISKSWKLKIQRTVHNGTSFWPKPNHD